MNPPQDLLSSYSPPETPAPQSINLIAIEPQESHSFLGQLLLDIRDLSDTIILVPLALTLILNIIVYESFLLLLYESVLSYYTYALYITLFFAANIVISVAFSLDFISKIIFYKTTSEALPNYNWFFFLLDFSAGPLASMLAIKLMISFEMQEYYLLFFLLNLKLFSCKTIRAILTKLKDIIPLLTPFLLYLFVFSYIFSSLAIILFGEDYQEDWGTYSKALFSVFQVLTLDSWARGGMLDDWSGMIIVAFYFMFNFCFFNFYTGCIVDYLGFSDEILAQISDINSGILEKRDVFWKNCVWGNHFSMIVKFLMLIIIVKDLLWECTLISIEVNQIVCLVIMGVYSAHCLLFILWGKKESREEDPFLDITILILNIVSGPVGLLVFLGVRNEENAVEYLNILLFLKCFTITPLKYILFDNFRVISMLSYFYLSIFVVVFLVGMLFAAELSLSVPDLFGSMDKGFYTVLEVVTLDGWASTILAAVTDYSDMAAPLEIALILLVHYIMINIVNALACNEMALIYRSRTRVSVTGSNELEVQKPLFRVVRRGPEEFIIRSMEIVGKQENFLGKLTQRRTTRLLNQLDQKLILSNPEDIQNYYLIRSALSNNKNFIGFNLLRNKSIDPKVRIKTLSSIRRKRNLIFQDNNSLIRRPIRKNEGLLNSPFRSSADRLNESKQPSPLHLRSEPAFQQFNGESLIFNTIGDQQEENSGPPKTIRAVASCDLLHRMSLENIESQGELAVFSSEVYELIYKGKRVKINNMNFLRINNNVRIECREQDLELNLRIRERTNTL